MLSKATIDDESISKLLKLKTRLTQSLADLVEEKSNVKQSLDSIRSQKELIRKQRAGEIFRSYNLKINLRNAQHQLEVFEKYMSESMGQVHNFEKIFKDEVGLVNFEHSVNNMISNVVGSINLYQEDSLQMELIKRDNITRAKRVELTNLQTQYNDLAKKAEEKKREIERVRQAELDRLKRIDEEKLYMERMKLKEQLHQTSNSRAPEPNSFLGNFRPSTNIFGAVNEFASTTGTFARKAFSRQSFNQAQTGTSPSSPEPPNDSKGVGFSQFFRYN